MLRAGWNLLRSQDLALTSLDRPAALKFDFFRLLWQPLDHGLDGGMVRTLVQGLGLPMLTATAVSALRSPLHTTPPMGVIKSLSRQSPASHFCFFSTSFHRSPVQVLRDGFSGGGCHCSFPRLPPARPNAWKVS